MWNWAVNFSGKVAHEIGSWISATAWILGKAAVGAVIGLVMGKHGLAFAAFVGLVIFDWGSCRYAVCRNWVADHYKVPIRKVGFWEAARSWNQARGEGHWQSRVMRGSGWDKIKQYIIWVIVASVADVLTEYTLGGAFWVNLTLGYFAVTELESIFENFGKAGVQGAIPISNLIKENKARFGFKEEEGRDVHK